MEKRTGKRTAESVAEKLASARTDVLVNLRMGPLYYEERILKDISFSVQSPVDVRKTRYLRFDWQIWYPTNHRNKVSSEQWAIHCATRIVPLIRWLVWNPIKRPVYAVVTDKTQ